jgi:hypothetical protein
MSLSPVIALRKALRMHLLGDAALVAALGSEKIFDEVPRDQEPPYIAFGDVQLREWDALLQKGAEQFLLLHVWSLQPGLRQVLSFAQELTELCDEASLVLEEHHLVSLRFQSLETKREDKGRFARATLRFRALTETL